MAKNNVMNSSNPMITVVILTRGRPERCRNCIWKTVDALAGLNASIMVINNDEVPLQVALPSTLTPINIINTGRNLGITARNIALEGSNSPYILMLDDDAEISRQTIHQALAAISSSSDIGAVSFRVFNGPEEEACLLPTAFHGCACLFRFDALKRIGGYPDWMLYYGEEYDLSIRMYQHGYKIVRINDETLGVTHARDPHGRRVDRIIRNLIRNNVAIWTRYFPAEYLQLAIKDTLVRYLAVAVKEKSVKGFLSAIPALPLSVLIGLKRRTTLEAGLFRKATMLDNIESAANVITSNGGHETVICSAGKFPGIWIKTLANKGITVNKILDFNTCWRNRKVGGTEVITCRSPADIEKNISNARFIITGTGSIPETTNWNTAISVHNVKRIQRESFSTHGIFDLLNDNKITVFARI